MYRILVSLQNRQRKFAQGDYKNIKSFRLAFSKKRFSTEIYCYIDIEQNRFRFFGFYSELGEEKLNELLTKLDKTLNN